MRFFVVAFFAFFFWFLTLFCFCDHFFCKHLKCLKADCFQKVHIASFKFHTIVYQVNPRIWCICLTIKHLGFLVLSIFQNSTFLSKHNFVFNKTGGIGVLSFGLGLNKQVGTKIPDWEINFVQIGSYFAQK